DAAHDHRGPTPARHRDHHATGFPRSPRRLAGPAGTGGLRRRPRPPLDPAARGRRGARGGAGYLQRPGQLQRHLGRADAFPHGGGQRGASGALQHRRLPGRRRHPARPLVHPRVHPGRSRRGRAAVRPGHLRGQERRRRRHALRYAPAQPDLPGRVALHRHRRHRGAGDGPLRRHGGPRRHRPADPAHRRRRPERRRTGARQRPRRPAGVFGRGRGRGDAPRGRYQRAPVRVHGAHRHRLARNPGRRRGAGHLRLPHPPAGHRGGRSLHHHLFVPGGGRLRD
ncbi:MAG: hypothetical protein AVDCRST_MAG89-294, partial [uncultured Gemmatimonadetes bacterium]